MTASQIMSPPFTRAVVNSMRKLYPESLADKSFDNTGLLLEALFDPSRRLNNSVLLTIDLTKAVADEAIERKDSIVVAYHPIIFRGLKSLTLQDTQQQSLLRLAAAGISVYSPHTAVDCAEGGLGDWLADIVTGRPSNKNKTKTENTAGAGLEPVLYHHPSQLGLDKSLIALGDVDHERYPIKHVKAEGQKNAGMGRIVRFPRPVRLVDIITRIQLGLGDPRAIPVAIPQGRKLDEMSISNVGICAGSGGSLFAEAAKNGEDLDLLFTGELSHHEALAAIEQGKCVITLSHSNSERGFLHGVLKQQLEDAVGQELRTMREESSDETDRGDAYREALADENVDIKVSERDRDPYGMFLS